MTRARKIVVDARELAERIREDRRRELAERLRAQLEEWDAILRELVEARRGTPKEGDTLSAMDVTKEQQRRMWARGTRLMNKAEVAVAMRHNPKVVEP